MAKRYVVTGGPCGGKSTTLSCLERMGYYATPEATRIALKNKIPMRNLYKVRLELEGAIPTFAEVAFLDRGFPDSLAFLRFQNLEIPEKMRELCRTDRYDGVFLFDMLPVYVKDEYRVYSREQSEELHKLIEEAYIGCGYFLVRVPVMLAEERAKFILESIGER